RVAPQSTCCRAPRHQRLDAFRLFQFAIRTADESQSASSWLQGLLGRYASRYQSIVSIWRECFAADKGPFLFGDKAGMADAMFAPVVTRFLSYDVKLDSDCAAYCATIMEMPPMGERVDGAKAEPDEVVELDVEF